MRKRDIIPFLVVMATPAILVACKWQLEMVWVGYATGWGYDFFGLGGFGWRLCSWRDFWWFMEFFNFIAHGAACCFIGWILRGLCRVTKENA